MMMKHFPLFSKLKSHSFNLGSYGKMLFVKYMLHELKVSLGE